MQIIVFEDEHVSRLHPVTVGRPAYAIGCGSFRLIDWLAQLSRETGVVLRGVARPHLEAIQQSDFPQLSPTAPSIETPALLVNARLVPSAGSYRVLRQLLDGLETTAIYENSSVAAAMIGPDGPAPPSDANADHWINYLHNRA